MAFKIDNKHLVELVRDNPCLYDAADGKYKDTLLKETIWTIITTQLKISDIGFVKTRWKSLRDRYTRERKEYLKRILADRNAQRPRWRLYNIIDSFLERSMEYQSSIISTVEVKEEKDSSPGPSYVPEDLEELDSTSFSEQMDNLPSPSVSHQSATSAPLRKKRSLGDDFDKQVMSLMQDVSCTIAKTNDSTMAALNKINEKQDDETYFYGRYLMSRLRSLSQQQFREARMEIEKVLYRIESEGHGLNNE